MEPGWEGEGEPLLGGGGRRARPGAFVWLFAIIVVIVVVAAAVAGVGGVGRG